MTSTLLTLRSLGMLGTRARSLLRYNCISTYSAADDADDCVSLRTLPDDSNSGDCDDEVEDDLRWLIAFTIFFTFLKLNFESESEWRECCCLQLNNCL